MPLRWLLATLLALALPAAALAQSPERPDGAEHWTPSAERMTFIAAGIGFPRSAGAVGLIRSIAFGQRNVGLDNGLIYASDDRALIATAYVYLPGLAHEGLASVVSEHFMRIQSGAGLRRLGSRIADAGGLAGTAIRADYAGFREAGEASSSAFLRVGHWLVKLRVSGPESRRADVERTIAAFLAEIRFESDDTPRPAQPVELGGDCPPAQAAPAAALLASNAIEATEDAIMAAAAGLDGSGRQGSSRSRADRSTFALRWCVSSLYQAGPYSLPILRIFPSPPSEDSRRSVALAILNDSGGALEIVERRFRNRSRFILLHHSNGQTLVLGSYDALPSDAQINAVLSGSDQAGGQARATIGYNANGNSTVTLHVAPDAGT